MKLRQLHDRHERRARSITFYGVSYRRLPSSARPTSDFATTLHVTKVSKLEHAVTSPSPADITTWCQASGVPEQIVELIAELHAADSLWLDWRRMERAGLRPAQESVRALYEATRLFRFYSSVMIPGPIQTAPYVRAVLTAIRDRRGLIDDVEGAVAERMDRQHILYEGDHRFSIVLEEATLRTVIGGSAVMAQCR